MENGLVSPSVEEHSPGRSTFAPVIQPRARRNTRPRVRATPGHRYLRYTRDDCNKIYVRSQRAGQRSDGKHNAVHHTKAQAQVNESKSAVARPQRQGLLGFSFSAGPEIKRMIAPKALDRFIATDPGSCAKGKGRQHRNDDSGAGLIYPGLARLFRPSVTTPVVLEYLTRWVRLRLRGSAVAQQWKTPRRRRAALLALGVRPRNWLATRPVADAAPGTSPRAKPSRLGFPMPLLQVATRPSNVDR